MKKIRLKHYINYLILGGALALFVVLDLLGALKRSDASLLTQIGYSIQRFPASIWKIGI